EDRAGPGVADDRLVQDAALTGDVAVQLDRVRPAVVGGGVAVGSAVVLDDDLAAQGQLAPGLRQQVDDLLRDVRTPAVRLAGVTGVARTVTAAGVIRTGVAGTGVTRSVALVVSAAQVEARIPAAVQVQLELVVGL